MEKKVVRGKGKVKNISSVLLKWQVPFSAVILELETWYRSALGDLNIKQTCELLKII